jgi:two-component system response regulator HydG
MTPIENPEVKTACLVDDDSAVLKSIGRLFASDGLSIRSFNKPKEFLSYAQTHSVPLVILDIWLEGMNGLEVQAQLSAISPRTRGSEIAPPNKNTPNRTNSYNRTLRLSRG